MSDTDNKVPREICPHCQGFDYREEHEINLKCLKENVKLQARLEKAEAMLRNIQDYGYLQINSQPDIKKYFAEVEHGPSSNT